MAAKKASSKRSVKRPARRPAKKSGKGRSFRPARNPRLRLFQKDGETFGTIDEKTFIAIPDVLLGALALANGRHTVEEIAFHLVKNTSMPREEMAARLESAFELMEKNGFVVRRR